VWLFINFVVAPPLSYILKSTVQNAIEIFGIIPQQKIEENYGE